jgi:hypothetical protein
MSVNQFALNYLFIVILYQKGIDHYLNLTKVKTNHSLRLWKRHYCMRIDGLILINKIKIYKEKSFEP